MREQLLSTLEVFKYASGSNNWKEADLTRIEAHLNENESLGRLSALILQNAITKQQLNWFSQSAQVHLKNSTTQLIVDIAAKRYFIKQLVPLLDQNNISVILLKGMAFNHYLYDANSPRGVSDIDILIRPEDKERFEHVFSQLAAVVEQEKQYAFDDLYEQTWRSNNNQHLIDVHTHLTNPHLFNIVSNQLWLRSKPHPAYETENVRVLGAEDTICHLVTHMINDTDFFHYNLIDVKKLILSESLNENLLVEIATQWGVLNATQFVLDATYKYLAGPVVTLKVEPSVLLSIRGKIAALIIKQLFTLACHEKSILHRFKQLCCYSFVLDRASTVFKISRLYFSSESK